MDGRSDEDIFFMPIPRRVIILPRKVMKSLFTMTNVGRKQWMSSLSYVGLIQGRTNNRGGFAVDGISTWHIGGGDY